MARQTSAARRQSEEDQPRRTSPRRPTLRKIVTSPNDHADRPGQTLETRSHDVIQQWAEARKAQPSSVVGSEREGHLVGLRFDFPGYSGRRLEHVSWDDWLKAFDERGLSFIYQETKRDGTESNFSRVLNPMAEDA